MPVPSSATYAYTVRPLSPDDQVPDEAPISIVCEPLVVPPGAGVRSTFAMRLKAGTTPEEAHAIASLLQTRVKGLCQLVASGEAEA